MGKIWEILNRADTILVFDIDGTLISYNYGEYRAHHELDDIRTEEEFSRIDMYNGSRGIPVIRDFLKTKDMDNIYCLSMEPHRHDVSKKKAVSTYYGILPSHVFLVEDHSQKPVLLKEIADMTLNGTNKLVFIDDNSKVLRAVEEQTPYYTAHVSIFFEDRTNVIRF
ncbi:MAG: hypothetical protein K5770_05300 [Lachnospiraceae bacterium]|nr:hypothetical protein [Lachnospiraceae bacterium]